MGRLSAGKSTGTSDKKTSRRLMGGGGGTGSSSASLATRGITTPDLIPRADVVDSFLQTNVPTAPRPTDVGSAPFVGAVDPNLQRLANELGTLNSNILPTVKSAAILEGTFNKQARKEAASTIAQHGSTKHPETVIGDISKKIQADINSGDMSPVEQRGAEKLLHRLGNNGRLQRYIQSENRIANVQGNALNLAASAREALIKTTDPRTGETIEVRLDSVPSSDPLYQKWLNDTIYGNQYLDPDEYEILKPIIVNAMSQDIARQDKAHTNYRKESFRTHINTNLDKVGSNLVIAGPAGIEMATATVQKDLDRLLGLVPELTAREQEEYKAMIPSILIQSFNKHNKNGTVSEDVLESVIKNLMVGPEESRILKIKDKDGLVIGTKINDKQRWYISEGGDNWLLQVLSEAKYEIYQAENNMDKADTYGSTKIAYNRINKEVMPLLSGKDKNVPEALKLITEIKKDFTNKAAKNNIPAKIVGSVLANIDNKTTQLLKLDSYTMQADMTELSKKLFASKTDATVLVELAFELDEFERNYLGNKDAQKFVIETRDKISFNQNPQYQNLNQGLQDQIEIIETDWMQSYASSSGSYNDTDVAEEGRMFTLGRGRLERIGTEIIIRNLKEGGTPAEIERRVIDEFKTAITRRNAGLIKKHEQTWTPERGPIYQGDSNTALTTIHTNFKISPGRTMSRESRWALINAVQGYTPLFGPVTTKLMVENALAGKMDPRLIRILKETNMKAGDFLLDQLGKFTGYIQFDPITRQRIEDLNGIKIQ